MTLVSTAARAGSSSGAGAVTLIQTITRATNGAIDFTAIPATYTHLLLEGQIKSSAANSSADAYLVFNNDTAANYDYVYLRGSGASASSAQFLAGGGANGMYLGKVTGNTAALAAAAGLVVAEIPFYAATTWNKNIAARSTFVQDATGSGVQIWQTGAQWRSTAAINRITIIEGTANNWLTGSTVSLYGIT